MPQSIKIISWNYDVQFEKGFLPYIKGATEIRKAHSYLNSYPRIEGATDFKIDLNRFAIVRVNGIAGLYSFDNRFGAVLPQVNHSENQRRIEILETYSDHLTKPFPFSNLFSFAWEKNHIADNALKNAIEIAKNTDVLVIIGYSFPFFNREIDKQILNAMKPSKTYYQVPEEDYDKYIDRLQGILEHPFKGINDKDDIPAEGYYFPRPKHIGDKDQFFIPYEL